MSLLVDIKKRLPGFSLTVRLEAGNDTLGLLGSSGCGKSMTLKCIAGVERPDEGVIVLDGRVLFDSKKGICIPARHRKTGYLFQNYALFPNMTVEENIMSGMRHVLKAQRSEKTGQLIALLRLEGLEKRFPRQLSGGQQQRVALARMLGSDPDILMFDEPFSALDQHLKEQMMPELLDIIDRFGKTALLVTHNIDEAYSFCSRIAVMSDGKIDVCGEKEQIFKNPVTLSAAKITGVKNISRIEKRSENSFFALDWGFELTVPAPLRQEMSFACIRAHHLVLSAKPSDKNANKNCIKCRVERTLESRFSKVVMLRPETAGADGEYILRYEADKQLFKSDIKNGDSFYVHFPPEKLMLLK